jgi:hypothetical protein
MSTKKKLKIQADVVVDGNITAETLFGNATSAGKVNAAVTFSGSGGASAGTSFDGSTAKTVSYNTIGAAAVDHKHQKLYGYSDSNVILEQTSLSNISLGYPGMTTAGNYTILHGTALAPNTDASCDLGGTIASTKRYFKDGYFTGTVNAANFKVDDTNVSLEGHTHQYAASNTTGGAASAVGFIISPTTTDQCAVWFSVDSKYPGKLAHHGSFTFQPSSGTLTATTFKGNLTGKATTAGYAEEAGSAGGANEAGYATTAQVLVSEYYDCDDLLTEPKYVKCGGSNTPVYFKDGVPKACTVQWLHNISMMVKIQDEEALLYMSFSYVSNSSDGCTSLEEVKDLLHGTAYGYGSVCNCDGSIMYPIRYITLSGFAMNNSIIARVFHPQDWNTANANLKELTLDKNHAWIHDTVCRVL